MTVTISEQARQAIAVGQERHAEAILRTIAGKVDDGEMRAVFDALCGMADVLSSVAAGETPMLPPMPVNVPPHGETGTRQSSGPEEADEYGDLFQPVEQPYRVISGLGVSGIKRLSERLREQGKDCD